MRLTAAAAVAVVITAVLPLGASSAATRHEDRTIDLPSGFEGEGITLGKGNTFYAGSLADGRIARGDLHRRTSEVWVDEPVVAPAVGMKADVRHRLLWVAGGPSGRAAIYDLRNADAVADLTLTSGPQTFINDVAVTRRAAYFTNSLTPELYRVPVSRWGEIGDPETITLDGPAGDFETGFNLNGIAATPDGRTLIVVNSVKGELYTVDASTGDSAVIDLGGDTVRTGDGILLSGRKLYVLQNGTQTGVPNQIVVIRLDRDLSSGRIVDTLSSPLFETATTLAKRGSLLAAVNAQFAGAPIDPAAEVVLLRAR